MNLCGSRILMGILLFLTVPGANALTLNEYLDQVKQTSPGVAASRDNIEGSLQTSREGVLTYVPRLTFDGSVTRDERLFTTSFLAGKTHSNAMIFGLQEQFAFGLNAKLSYNLVNNKTSSLNGLIFPGGELDYTSAQTQLDLIQPLWKNGFGVETRANETISEASSLANHYQNRYQLKQMMAQAEAAYYELSIARESSKLMQEVVERAKEILNWNSRRVREHLADKVDMLQAQAAYQARQLDYSTGLNEERAARLNFNTLRNDPHSEVSEELEPVSVDRIIALQVPQKEQTPDDVKAVEQNQRAVVANNELSRQKAQPDLSLYGTVAYNGVDNYLSPALKESFTTAHPLYVAGVRFSIPLDFWETSAIRAGRVKQQLAAEKATLEKRLESDQAWEDLTKRFAETKAQLKLADQLVQLQHEKLKYEKYRFNVGRTTTYQVLTFEQDYQQAVLTRFRIAQQALVIYSQLKTYAPLNETPNPATNGTNL